MDFVEYCKKNIFEPLGMHNTYWRLEAIGNNTIAQLYENYSVIEHYTFTDYPNGGLRSTAEDMSYFLQAFANSGVSRKYQLLQPQTVKEMLTLQIPKLSDDT
jgi:CubicO group peptidase (beta-lactamase class C family)